MHTATAQRSASHLGRSQRVLDLSGWIGHRSVELPSDWARPYEDVVVAFDLYDPTNWQAHLVSTDGEVLLAFPWHDNADRILGGHRSGDFPIHADDEAWDALEEGWWAWVKADGPHVYVAECDGDMIGRIRRTRKLRQRSPGLVAVDKVGFSWSRVPRVAYDRAWQDAIDTCRAGQPSPVGEWISDAPEDRRMRLRF
jgi:hypothetical protein